MNRFCSIFSQLLQLFSRIEFQRAVTKPMPNVMPEVSPAGGSSWPCSFASWAEPFPPGDHRRLRSCEGKLKHLGIPAPSRSTLAYANEPGPGSFMKRSSSSFWSAVGCKEEGKRVSLQEQAGQSGCHHDRSLPEPVRLGPLPQDQGAIKLHLLLDHDGYLPSSPWSPRGRWRM